jgi:hypothetical protein
MEPPAPAAPAADRRIPKEQWIRLKKDRRMQKPHVQRAMQRQAEARQHTSVALALDSRSVAQDSRESKLDARESRLDSREVRLDDSAQQLKRRRAYNDEQWVLRDGTVVAAQHAADKQRRQFMQLQQQLVAAQKKEAARKAAAEKEAAEEVRRNAVRAKNEAERTRSARTRDPPRRATIAQRCALSAFGQARTLSVRRRRSS